MARIIFGILLFVLASLPVSSFADDGTYEGRQVSSISKGCLNDRAKDCYDLGMYYGRVRGDFRPYRVWLQRSCDLKHLEACEQIEFDDSEGEKIRQKCELGAGESCHHYAIGSWLMHRDFARALKYLGKACDLGVADACAAIKKKQEEVQAMLERK